MGSWTIGDVEVVRIDDPGFELLLLQDDATAATLAASPWLQPHFVTEDMTLVIGSSATVIRAADRVVLVDPFLAFGDGCLDGRLQALRDAGVEPDDVDLVVNTHVDHLGANLRDGAPAFPNARYLIPQAELDSIASGQHAQSTDYPHLLELQRAGTVEGSAGDEVVAPGVRLEDAPGHNPGHHVVWVEDGGASAVIVGHLFLHPAQIAAPEVTIGDLDPALLERTRRSLLDRCAASDTLLIGPLFASPGAGRVRADGDSWRLEV